MHKVITHRNQNPVFFNNGLSSRITQFIAHDIKNAIHFVLTQNVYEDPAYYNLLCSHLLESRLIDSNEVVGLLKTQSLCVSFLQNQRATTVCVRKMINADPSAALLDAMQFHQPEINPHYYLRLCDLLGQDMAAISLGADHYSLRLTNLIEGLCLKLTNDERKIYAELNYKKAYCLSLMGESKGMRSCLKLAVAIDYARTQTLVTESSKNHANNDAFIRALLDAGLSISRSSTPEFFAPSPPPPSSPNGASSPTHYRYNPYSSLTKQMLTMQGHVYNEPANDPLNGALPNACANGN